MQGYTIRTALIRAPTILSVGIGLLILFSAPSLAQVPDVGPSGCVPAPGMPCGGGNSGGGGAGASEFGGSPLAEMIGQALEWLADIPDRIREAHERHKSKQFNRLIDAGLRLEQQGKYAEAITQFTKAATWKPYGYAITLRSLAHAQLAWALELYNAERLEAAYALFVEARNSAQDLIDYTGISPQNIDWIQEALAWPDFVGKKVEKLRIARQESALGRAVLQQALDHYAATREKERQSVIQMRGSLLARMKKGRPGNTSTPAKKGTDLFGTGGTPADPHLVERPTRRFERLETALEQAESAQMHAARAAQAGTKGAASEEARRPFDTAGEKAPQQIDPKLFQGIEGTRKAVLGHRPLPVLPPQLLQHPGWKILQHAERTILIDLEHKRLAINSLERRAEVARQTGDQRTQGRLQLQIDIMKQVQSDLKKEIGEVKKEKQKMLARFNINLEEEATSTETSPSQGQHHLSKPPDDSRPAETAQ